MVDQHRPGPVDVGGFGVFCGLDVGKGIHHAVALAPDGRRLHDGPLPQDKTWLGALFTDLSAHGRVLVVVDQPATIGALPVAVARDAGAQVDYLPGLAMRRIADLHPGTAKTDARDAYVMTDAARTMPHTCGGSTPVRTPWPTSTSSSATTTTRPRKPPG